MALLDAGSVAPDFTLPDEQGVRRSLAELRKNGPVVVYFYPRDDSPGCTVEACKFRDDYEDFTAAGAAVVGISSDGASAHQSFKAKHGLPFTLLSDPGAVVARSFGVKRLLGLLPGRATFVIDQAGVVRLSFSSHSNMQAHVEQALATLRSLG